MRVYNIQSLIFLTASLMQNIALMCKCEQISPLVSWTDWAGLDGLVGLGLGNSRNYDFDADNFNVFNPLCAFLHISFFFIIKIVKLGLQV